MYQSPRRPYFNRTQNMPQSVSHDDSVSMDSNRFWNLLKQLKRRQQDARQDNERQQPAKSGK